MVDYVYLILKIFIGNLAFIPVLFTVYLILSIIPRVIRGKGIKAVNTVIMVNNIILIYSYGFLGAYIYQVFSIYSIDNISWINYILCLLLIFGVMKVLVKEWKRQQNEVEQMTDRELFEIRKNYTRKGLDKLLIVKVFQWNYMILISFLIFTFFPNLVGMLYFNLPKYLSELFF
jgi:hypothetical protein